MPTAPLKFTVYKFIAPYTQSYCTKMGGTGASGCLEWGSRDFKIGDTVVSMGNGVVSDGTNPPFVNGQLYGADANGGTGSIPLSVLEKVATDIEASQLNKYIGNVTQNNPFPTGLISPPMSGLAKFAIGVAIVIIILGILKLFKVF